MLTYLHKASTIGYMPVPSFAGTLFFTAQFGDPEQTAAVKAFQGLWAVQLAESTVPKQWLVAYALASIGKGYHEFDLFYPPIESMVERLVPKKYYSGNPREALRAVGIFSLILPVARWILKDRELTAKQLLATDLQFQLIRELYNREQNTGEQDDIKLALRVHGSDFEYARNPYRINYRGEFLPQFIMYHNTATKLNSQEQTTHAAD